VSQARLWLAGDLHVRQDFAASAPWPNAEWTFAPVGYRPADRHTIVPTYAPGLPLLMAIFVKVAGDCGAFMVAPLCGALLVLLTYGLGVQLSGRVTGTVAAILIAASPAVLFMSMWSMSDVPAAVFWTASLLMASRRSASMAAAAGIAAGAAVAIRPNLVPLAVVPAAMIAWSMRHTTPADTLRRVIPYALGCAPFIAFVAWHNYEL
jgi:4-amino-4-deoxy-L-arabinose transferase-like glycosyltransferase